MWGRGLLVQPRGDELLEIGRGFLGVLDVGRLVGRRRGGDEAGDGERGEVLGGWEKG